MNENNIEIIEEIMQYKISEFIKKNKNMDKKELAKRVDEMLEEKEKMYTKSNKELKEILKNK